jgi:hypothetical protein
MHLKFVPSETSRDAAFAYDAIQIRAVSRVSFGFMNPAGLPPPYLAVGVASYFDLSVS